MGWRVLATVLYAAALGGLMALDNTVGVPDVLWLVAWLAAPVVGFLVGRWWAVFAVLGAIFGRTIGWDSGENDGNPALWAPYVVTTALLIGFPLLAGVVCSYLWRSRQGALADDRG
jgi:hypothetical protein